MLLVIIPAYNEAETIGVVLSKIDKKIDVLVVNDGSVDQTSKISKYYGAKVINSKKNFGVDYSMNLGFKYALTKKYKYVVTMDADGQHSNTDLNKIVKILKNHKADLVISVRSDLPRVSEKIFSYYTYKKFKIRDLLSGLKGYNLDLFKSYGSYDTFNSIGTELSIYALKNNYKIKTININVKNRIDKPRLGGSIKGNHRIFKALLNVMLKT